MKIIRSMQGGGVAYIPVVGPSTAQQATSATSSNDEAKNLQSELIGILKENGLPNDVDKFLNQINGVLNSSLDGEFSMSTLISAVSLANRVKHNAKLHEVAQKRLDDEDAGSEVAMTPNGEIYALSNKGLTTITASEYSKNRDKYRALSNSDLLHLRQENSSLAFNSNILNNLAKTTGLKSVSEYVVKLINDFGEYKRKNESSPYSNIQMNKISDGLRQMIGDGPSGYYKLNQSTSKSDQGYTDAESFQAAVDYIYNSLPAEMKNVLKAHTAVEGRDSNKKADVQSLLMQAVSMHTDHAIETSFKPDYEGVTVGGGSGKGSGSSKLEKVDFAESFQYGREVPYTTMMLAQNTLTADGRSAIRVPVQMFSLVDYEGKAIAQGNLKVTLDKFAASTSLDRSSISFGDQMIEQSDLTRLVTDGTGALGRAILPIDQEAAHYGTIRPDFAALDRYNELKKWIDRNPGVAPNKIIERARELNLDVEYKNGELIFNPRSCRAFAVMGAMASTDAIKNLDPDSNWIQKLQPHEDTKRVFEQYKQLTNYTGDIKGKSNKMYDSYDPGFLQFRERAGGKMVRGQVYIPILEGPQSTVHLGKPLTEQSSFYNVGARFAAEQVNNNIKASF